MIGHQRDFDKKVKAELMPGFFICVIYYFNFYLDGMILRMDFVGFEFQEEKCKALKVNDLVVVAEWICINI